MATYPILPDQLEQTVEGSSVKHLAIFDILCLYLHFDRVKRVSSQHAGTTLNTLVCFYLS